MLYKYSQLNFNKLYTGFPSSTVNNALAKLSPLPPDFDPCDRQWLFDSGCERVYGGRPLGHEGFLGYSGSLPHQ